MKYPFLFARIFIAIVLTLVIGILPHHHHHGEPCWVFTNYTVHHHGEPLDNNCPSDPCEDTTCFLQSMKTFLQTERPDQGSPYLFDAVLPEKLQIGSAFIILKQTWIATDDYPMISVPLETLLLRGPPTC